MKVSFTPGNGHQRQSTCVWKLLETLLSKKELLFLCHFLNVLQHFTGADFQMQRISEVIFGEWQSSCLPPPMLQLLYCAKPPRSGCCSRLRHRSVSSCWAFWQCFVALSRLVPLKWAPLAQFKDILYQWSCIHEMPCAGKTKSPSPTSSIYTPSLLKPSAKVAALLGGTAMKERPYLLETLEQSKQIHWAKVSLQVA